MSNFKFIKQLNEELVTEEDMIDVKDSFIITNKEVSDLPRAFHVVIIGKDGNTYRSKAGFDDKTRADNLEDKFRDRGSVERRKLLQTDKHGHHVMDD